MNVEFFHYAHGHFYNPHAAGEDVFQSQIRKFYETVPQPNTEAEAAFYYILDKHIAVEPGLRHLRRGVSSD